MARSLGRAGLLAGVFNRTAATADTLAAELGVAAYRTPAALAAASHVIVTMLADEHALRSVYCGDDGIAGSVREGSVAVEMSTIGPQAVHWLAELLEPHGCRLVDAPVSGSVSLAESGELTILAGGDPADVERVSPVLEAIGSRVFHLGAAGTGAIMKLAVNNVVYGLNQSVAESLVLAERAGIERRSAYGVFAASAASAPFVHYRRREFEEPGSVAVSMPMRLAEKDLELILALGDTLSTPLPQAELNAGIARAAGEAGFAESDISAIAEYLRGNPLPRR
jgi:3-hydroxyisobutyrate dehydrogenase/2-hydroxy-3-oxopropionate reductase